MNKTVFLVSTLLAATSLFAQVEEESTSIRGLTFSAGYAWRAKARTSFKAGGGGSASGGYQNGAFNSATDWSYTDAFESGRYQDPNYGEDLYSMGLTRTESVGGGKDDDSASGLNLAVAYAIWGNESFDVSLNGRFAGYWNIKNSSAGGNCSYVDYYSFASPTPSMGYGEPTAGDAAHFEERVYGAGGSAPPMKLKSDLYQIGLGPKFTYHAFSSLDVYCGVEALVNIINTDFTTSQSNTSETNCRLGFGGQLGFVGWITERVGVYGQVGYEWIDKDDCSSAGCSAKTDYSSLVLSTGIVVGF